MQIFLRSVIFRSKTAAKLQESRTRFDRLNIKLQMQSLLNGTDPPSTVSTTISASLSTTTTTATTTTSITPALPTVSQNDEDDMDAFLRQAYADGMFDDDPPVPDPPSPPNTAPALAPVAVALPARTSTSSAPATNIRPKKEVIIISDEEEDHHRYDLYRDELPPIYSSPPPLCRTPPPKITVSVPYTYLSIVRSQSIPTYQTHQDYIVQGCFSSLVSNPRLIKNEYELQAYLNDGSDCLLVRLASDLLAQRIGITVNELLTKRQNCKTDIEKQRFQTDFNERLKQFGSRMGQVIGLITVRCFSDNRMPTVMCIDES